MGSGHSKCGPNTRSGCGSDCNCGCQDDIRREHEARVQAERQRIQEEENRRREEQARQQQKDRIQKESKAREEFNNGMKFWDTAWDMEKNGNDSGANAQFKLAQQMFQTATNAIPENVQYSRYAKLAEYKINGNAAFNAALRIHEEANKLHKLGQFVDAARKYSLAMELYRNGAKVGDRNEVERFVECIGIVGESIETVKNAVRTMATVQQVQVLQQLRKIVNEKQGKQVVNENSNIDVVFQYLKDSNI